MTPEDPELAALIKQVSQTHGKAALALALVRAIQAVPGSDGTLSAVAANRGSDKPLDGMTLSLRNEVIAIFKADLQQMMKLQ